MSQSPTAYSRANFFKEKGNMTLQTDFSKSIPKIDPMLYSRTPQARMKATEDTQTYSGYQKPWQNQAKPPNKEIIYTNIQNPQQMRQKATYTQLSTSSIIQRPEQQLAMPRARVNNTTAVSLQTLGPIKPTYSVLPVQNHAKGFQLNPMINFDNRQSNKYKEYEYTGFQNQEIQRANSQAIKQSTQQNILSMQNQINTNNARSNVNSRSHTNLQPMVSK